MNCCNFLLGPLLFIYTNLLPCFSISQDSLPLSKLQEDTVNLSSIIDIGSPEPEFPGGLIALEEFVLATVVYPQEAKKNKIQGTVYVQFVVDETGGIEEVEIFRSVADILDQEAIRVVKAMPNWIPGEINGKAVRVRYVLPIRFN